MVDAFLRPGEAVKLETAQFIAPQEGPGFSKLTLLLHPRMLNQWSKTHVQDESIQIDRQWLSD
eukprot:278808-Amphidinium_carterae.1